MTLCQGAQLLCAGMTRLCWFLPLVSSLRSNFFICLRGRVSVCRLFVCMSVCTSAICVSFWLAVVCPSVWRSVRLSVCLSVCLHLSLLVCMFVCMQKGAPKGLSWTPGVFSLYDVFITE